MEFELKNELENMENNMSIVRKEFKNMQERLKKSEGKNYIGEINDLKNEIKNMKEINKIIEKENNKKEKELNDLIFDLKKKVLEYEDFIKGINNTNNNNNSMLKIKGGNYKNLNNSVKNNNAFSYAYNSNNITNNNTGNINLNKSNPNILNINKAKINTSIEGIKESDQEGNNNQEKFEKIVKNKLKYNKNIIKFN